MKHYSSTDCPVVVIDKETFYDIQKQANLNKELIEQLAFDKYLDNLNEHGLDIKLTIDDSKNVIYGCRPRIVVPVVHTEQSFTPVKASAVIENIKTAIVDEIVDEANGKLTDKRQSIIDEVKKGWEDLIKERNTWKLLSLIFAAAFFASMFANIYLAFNG